MIFCNSEPSCEGDPNCFESDLTNRNPWFRSFFVSNKMENKKYPIVGTGSTSNRKIVETETKSIPPSTHINDSTLYWLGENTSIRSGGVKLVLLTQTSPLSEMMWSCKSFPHV